MSDPAPFNFQNDPRPKPVCRCVCMDLLFSDLKQSAADLMARQLGQSEQTLFDSLRQTTGCCTGCGTCEPYVRLMLRTGDERFPVLSAAEVNLVMGKAQRGDTKP